MSLRKLRQMSVSCLLWCFHPTGESRRIVVISHERKQDAADRLQPLQYIFRLVDRELRLRKLSRVPHPLGFGFSKGAGLESTLQRPSRKVGQYPPYLLARENGRTRTRSQNGQSSDEIDDDPGFRPSAAHRSQHNAAALQLCIKRIPRSQSQRLAKHTRQNHLPLGRNFRLHGKTILPCCFQHHRDAVAAIEQPADANLQSFASGNRTGQLPVAALSERAGFR
jgi:hypothetical protein